MKTSQSINGTLSAAMRVAELGLRVHPLNGKVPTLRDWPAKATADPAAIQEWLSLSSWNYGIVCDQVAAIDADTQELAAWWDSHRPGTPWTVRTPGGGTHFFYRSVAGLRNAVKVQRGWDVRAGGRGYVVGFGSVVDGRRYQLIGKATLDLPPFDPAWLPPVVPVSVMFPRTTAVHPSGHIRNVDAYIRKVLSIQGHRGSDACFRVACILRDEGKTAEEALELMLEWNAVAAFPPWSTAEIQKKIHDSYARLAKGG